MRSNQENTCRIHLLDLHCTLYMYWYTLHLHVHVHVYVQVVSGTLLLLSATLHTFVNMKTNIFSDLANPLAEN